MSHPQRTAPVSPVVPATVAFLLPYLTHPDKVFREKEQPSLSFVSSLARTADRFQPHTCRHAQEIREQPFTLTGEDRFGVELHPFH